MARIDDYNTYLAGKNKNFTNEHYFVCDLKYTDIIVRNNPPEMMDIDDSKCEVEYEAVVSRNKMGIDGIEFRIHKIELEVKVDDYPNEPKSFEFEIEPGINVDLNHVVPEVLSHVIPTYPRQITIDMRKSMEVKDFMVIVEFGREE